MNRISNTAGRAKRFGAALALGLSLPVGMAGTANAQQTIGKIADEAGNQISNVGKLMVAGGFLIGVIMVVAGLMKLKQAADTQGQQVKYGEGLWRLAVGAGLVALPAISNALTASAGLGDVSITSASGF